MLSNPETVEEEMKKQYIKPETKEVVVTLIGSILDTPGFRSQSKVAKSLGAREANVSWDDDEDEIEDSMWK